MNRRSWIPAPANRRTERGRVPRSLVAAAALGACGPAPLSSGSSVTDSAATSGDPGTSAGSSPGSSSGSSSGSSAATEDPTSSGVDSLSTGATPDMPRPEACETWNDTCPEGMKCLFYSSSQDGAPNPDAQGCFDLVPDPAGLGEACTGLSVDRTQLDTCGAGLACWYGECVPFCLGTPGELTCPEGFYCTFGGDQTVVICRDYCHPLEAGCSARERCVQLENIFRCTASIPDAGPFDPCTAGTGCEPGFMCGEAKDHVQCEGRAGCCLELCDLADPAQCTNGEACIAPAGGLASLEGYENLGICASV